MNISESFLWGAASSAYQIEGFPTEDGGGESIWDTFCRTPGTIADGTDGSVSCDAYHHILEDLRIAHQLGLKAYRFSISWARIDPSGTGEWNQTAMNYYTQIAQECRLLNIEPIVTLHHWELPQKVQDRGGWLNPDIVSAFERYTDYVSSSLSHLVQYFITINEPQCIIFLGHEKGIHAPGLKLDQNLLFLCWKHILLAHGYSFRCIRRNCPQARISLATTGRLCYPSEDKDYAASYEESFALYDDDWGFTHSLFLDPICKGCLSPTPGSHLEELVHTIRSEEWDIMHTSLDFLSVNVYNGSEVRDSGDGRAEYVKKQPGYPVTALKWPITEKVMHYGIIHLYNRYRLPILISENGLSCCDKIYLDGQVHDADRIDFLTRYLRELMKASDQVPLIGYLHWSLTDNFEWHSGYLERFGLIYIDYPTRKRILKDSARWYARVIAANGKSLQD